MAKPTSTTQNTQPTRHIVCGLVVVVVTTGVRQHHQPVQHSPHDNVFVCTLIAFESFIARWHSDWQPSALSGVGACWKVGG